ncbi:MAG: hypothetical protein M2R45_00461 [Verrucomicrobia subdivision 3 bacterium]|nr:hypothetical protein [Limisphaerales bacterium]MCS1413659.1 hypothetical protein [Limisphaerales bacterium]
MTKTKRSSISQNDIRVSRSSGKPVQASSLLARIHRPRCGNHERGGRDDEKEIGTTFAHAFRQLGSLRGSEERYPGFVALGDVTHVTITTDVDQVEVTIADAKLP